MPTGPLPRTTHCSPRKTLAKAGAVIFIFLWDSRPLHSGPGTATPAVGPSGPCFAFLNLGYWPRGRSDTSCCGIFFFSFPLKVPCNPGWPQNHDSHASLPSAGITGVHHRVQFYTLVASIHPCSSVPLCMLGTFRSYHCGGYLNSAP